jgi:hypothetical protein
MVHNSQPSKSPGFWYRLVHLEPAIIRGVIMAGVAVLASVGIFVSEDLPNDLVLLITVVFALIQALWTRSATIPTEKVVAYVEDPEVGKQLVAGPAVPARSVTDEQIHAAVSIKGE